MYTPYQNTIWYPIKQNFQLIKNWCKSFKMPVKTLQPQRILLVTCILIKRHFSISLNSMSYSLSSSSPPSTYSKIFFWPLSPSKLVTYSPFYNCLYYIISLVPSLLTDCKRPSIQCTQHIFCWTDSLWWSGANELSF